VFIHVISLMLATNGLNLVRWSRNKVIVGSSKMITRGD